MNKWHLLALLPSLVFAGNLASMNLRKDPVYVDVQPDQVTICSENTVIPSSRLSIPGNEFELLMGYIERVREVRYVILVLRPGSENTQRKLRQILQKYSVDVGFEPWEAERPISQEEMSKPYLAAAPEPQGPTYVIDI